MSFHYKNSGLANSGNCLLGLKQRGVAACMYFQYQKYYTKQQLIGTIQSIKNRFLILPNENLNPDIIAAVAHSLTLSKYRTELSKYIGIIKQCQSYNYTTIYLCIYTHTKFILICHPEYCSLNSRSELSSKCRHENKFLLNNITKYIPM